jgi:glutathione peroxidase-family protein
LVGRDGRVAARLSPNVRPLALKPKIQALLAGGDQAGGQLMST